MRYILTMVPHGAYIFQGDNIDTTVLIKRCLLEDLIPSLRELDTKEIYVFKSSISLEMAELIGCAGFEIRLMEE